MIRVLITILCLASFVIKSSFTQEFSIEASWKVGYGSKGYTSRDELFKVTYDADSNLLVLGSVERDSTFRDIIIQKYSQNGILIWQQILSSGIQLDFDVPLDLKLDKNNNIIILSKVSGYYDYELKPVIYKIDQDGNQIWKINILEYSPEGFEINFSEISISDDNEIRFIAIGKTLPSTNCLVLKFSGAGELLESRSWSDVETSGFWKIPIAYSVNSDSIFSLNKTYHPYSDYRVLRLWQITEFNSNHIELDLSEEDKTVILGKRYEFKKTDPNGNFYFIDNYNGGFQIIKVFTNGTILRKIFQKTDYSFVVENICFSGMNMLLIGRQADSLEISLPFVIELDPFLKELNSNTLAEFSNFAPKNILFCNDFLFAVLVNEQMKESYIVRINKNLDPISVYKPGVPQGYEFLFAGLFELKDKCYLGGTIIRPKFEGSVNTSERELFIESFSFDDSIKYWDYTHTESGTSFIESHNIIQNNNNDIYVFTVEAVGPHYTGPFAYDKYYLYKFDSLGNQVMRNEFDSYCNYRKFKFDSENYLYVFAFKSPYNYILRISPDGKEILSYPIIYPVSITIGTDNHIFVQYHDNDPRKENYRLIEFDSEFNMINQRDLEGRIIQLFYLEDDLVYYTYDPGISGKDSYSDIRLFINHDLQWTRNIDEYTHNEGLFDSDYNKNTGCLYFITENGIVDRYLHRLTIDNKYSLIDLGIEDNLVSYVRSFSNGNLVVKIGNRLELFSEDLSEKSSYPVESPAKPIIFNDYIFQINESGMSVYDNNLDLIGAALNQSIFNCTDYLISDDYSIYTIEFFDKLLYIPIGDNGIEYRTKMGILSKYALSDYINFREPTTGLESAGVFEGFIHYQADNEIIVIDRNVNNHCNSTIKLIDMYGRVNLIHDWLSEEPSTRILISDLPKGVYVLIIYNNSGSKILYKAKVLL